jgi:FtsZ-binding cell division protein ZapB
MDEGFELLEQKVRQAAETVRRLREQNRDLEHEKARLQQRVQEAEKAASAPRTSAAEARRLESLSHEVELLQREREEVRKRIAALLRVLETLDSV